MSIRGQQPLRAVAFFVAFYVVLAKVQLPADLLPDNVVPEEYHLTIVPYMEASTPFYDCSLVINILCQRPTNTVKFHSGANLGLTRSKFSLRSRELAEKLDQDFLYDTYTQQFTAVTSRTIQKGERFSLVVESFRANYSDHPLGFHRYPVKKRIDLVVTQFQENEARRVFPCFDEPRFRSVFHIVMFRQEKSNIETRSNSDLRETIQYYPGWLADIYEKTLRLPTYTIAFAAFRRPTYQVHERIVRIYDREVKIGLIQNPNESNIATTSQKCNFCCHLDDIFDLNKDFLRYMEDYLGMPYPMTKYDLLISRNAVYAGMENMGLVVIKSGNSCARQVYGHEVVHQWIGNIVTPYWWGDLWLSEGLTTFFEKMVFEILYPEQDKSTSMTIKKYTYAAFREDSKFNDTIPAISHESEPLEEKTTSVYYKASTFVRMLVSVIGDKIFQASLRRYFQLFKYSHVTHENFIDIIERFFEPSPINIRTFTETWLHNSGFPVVTFSRVKGRIIARQFDMFNQSRLWQIPLIWALDCQKIHGQATSVAPMQYFMTREVEFLPVKVKDTECFLSNQHLQFYYLPLFDNQTFELLFNMSANFSTVLEQQWREVNDSGVKLPIAARRKLLNQLESFSFISYYLRLLSPFEGKPSFAMISEFFAKVDLSRQNELLTKIIRASVSSKKERRTRKERRRRRKRRKRRGRQKGL